MMTGHMGGSLLRRADVHPSGIREDARMSNFREGQPVWVEQPGGEQRAAIFVGEAEASWFGGGSGAYVVYPDTRSGEEVAIMRIVPREDE